MATAKPRLSAKEFMQQRVEAALAGKLAPAGQEPDLTQSEELLMLKIKERQQAPDCGA